MEPATARTTRSGAADEGEGKTTLSAAQDKALRDKFAKTFVVVPSDADVAARPCAICKEPFKSQWSEDEEEWIWLNAIRVEDNGNQVYYHASCHHSAKSLTDSVADRRTASVGVKRRSTSRTATPSASTAARKRKSDLEPALDIVEEPPTKKSAV